MTRLRMVADDRLRELERVDLPVAAGMTTKVERLTGTVVDVLVVQKHHDPRGGHDRPRKTPSVRAQARTTGSIDMSVPGVSGNARRRSSTSPPSRSSVRFMRPRA